jgi:hypothetical protein
VQQDDEADVSTRAAPAIVITVNLDYGSDRRQRGLDSRL